MAEKNYPIKVFYSIFFTPPRWADVAFVWRRPARMRGRPIKPHTSAQRAPRRGANGCADVRFLTCAAVQPLIFRPEAALGSGFSLQAAFWYQNAMLALFLRSKKSLKRSLSLIPPFRTPHIISLFLHFEFRSRYISRYEKLNLGFLPFVVATIVATAAIQAALPGSRRLLAAVFVSFAFSTRRFSPPNRIGAQISKILS